MEHSIKTPLYKVNVNNKGHEWVQVDNLVFKLNRESEYISVFMIDEKEKCSYTVLVDNETMEDKDKLQFKLNKCMQVTEGQLLVLKDCLANYNLHGTMFKKTNKSYKTTKKGNNYVETDQYLITVSRHGRAIVVKAISERNEYIIVIDEHDIHSNTKMMDHLDTLNLTISEFGAVLDLINDTYYDDFGYQGGE